ncbi:hypothetical protein G7046_g1207 [Stylonectria norvegica]|nr:hypothetical protein G7046_g1207 [Stylonectria norvegica]
MASITISGPPVTNAHDTRSPAAPADPTLQPPIDLASNTATAARDTQQHDRLLPEKSETRQQRVDQLVHLAETGSEETVQFYDGLRTDFDDVDDDLPKRTRKIIQALQQASIPTPVVRDSRRGQAWGIRQIATAWDMTEPDLKGFFEDAYLSRGMIAKLRTFASRVQFDVAAPLLREARDHRRYPDRDHDTQEDVRKRARFSRSHPWRPVDVDRAMAASGHFADLKVSAQDDIVGEEQVGASQEPVESDAEAADLEGDEEEGTKSAPLAVPEILRHIAFGDARRHHLEGSDHSDDAAPKTTVTNQPLDSPFEALPPIKCEGTSPRDHSELQSLAPSSSPISPTPEFGRRYDAAGVTSSRPGRFLDISSDEHSRLGANFPRSSAPSSPLARISKRPQRPNDNGDFLPTDTGLATVSRPGDESLGVLAARSDVVGRRDRRQITTIEDNDKNMGLDESTLPASITHSGSLWPAHALETLAPGAMLCDRAIHCVMSILVAAAPSRVCNLDPLLAAIDYRKPFPPSAMPDPESRIFVPLHLPNNTHWVLAVIHPCRELIDLCDSLPSASHTEEARQVVGSIMQHLDLDPTASQSAWTILSRLTPVQDNSYDCGVFVLITTLYLLTGHAFPIDPIDGSLWRQVFRSLLANPHDEASAIQQCLGSKAILNPTMPAVPSLRLQDWMGQISSAVRTASGPVDEALATAESRARELEAMLRAIVDAKSLLEQLHVSMEPAAIFAPQLDAISKIVADCEQELSHLRPLLSLGSQSLSQVTLRNAMEACTQQLAQSRKKHARLRTQQRQHSHARDALTRAADFCGKVRERVLSEQQALHDAKRKLAKFRSAVSVLDDSEA